MGFVADLSQSTISLEHRPEMLNALKPEIRPITNRVICPMISFEATAGFKFDPKHGAPPAGQTESCRIGLVQNLLYERMTIKYDDGTQKNVTYERAIVDCGDTSAFPFYNIPGAMTRAARGNNAQNATEERTIIPYRWVTFNQRGFGELLDPWATGDSLIVLSSAAVSLIDQPFFAMKLRTRSGGLLTEAMQILTFAIWLVALPEEAKKPPQVLAHTGPFSLLYSCSLSTRGKMLTIGTPDSAFTARAKKGRARNPKEFTKSEGLRFSPGQGGIAPTLKGDTANTRDQKWNDTLLGL